MIRTEEAVDAWRAALSASGLPRVDELLQRRPDSWLPGEWQALTKPGLGTRERWRWVLPGDPPRVLFLKRYLGGAALGQMDRLRRQSPRHSRAWWEFHCARELSALDISVARPVAFAEEMSGRVERRSVVLLETARGASLERVCGTRECAALPPQARRDLAVRLGRFICAFHSAGWCHRDLYLCHVFLYQEPDGPPEFTLIDLARCHRPRWRRMRWLLKDLSQLDASARQVGVSRCDRLRFLLAYLGLQPGARRIRWYAVRILRRSDRILRRIARKSGAA